MRDIKDYDQNILSEQKRKEKMRNKKGESQWALDIQTNILPDEDKSIEKNFFKKDASNNSTKKEML